MTLAELETLVRRIEDFLDRPAVIDAAARKLAADYFTIGRAAGLRLNQCAAMLAAGDEHQALQLAETPPALLDMITLLSFRRSPAWRALCRAENLPEPESFDVKALRRLNDAYAKGIDGDHALYRDYRRAVMLNEDAAALGILRSIVRLNPNDKNAKGELERLEKKQRAAKAEKLEALVAVHEPGHAAQIAQLVDELETELPGLDSSGWLRAQAVRAAVLLQRAKAAQAAGALREAQQLLKRLAMMRHLLNQMERALLDDLDRWAVLEAERRKQEASRKAAVDHLAAVAHRLEQEQHAPQKRPLAELRVAAETLERSWRQVERYRSEIPRDLIERVERLRDGLEKEIARAVRASRRLAFAAVGLVVLTCAIAAVMAYSRQAANALAHRIETMIAERRVSEAETTLAGASSSPALARVRAQAVDFLQREKTLKHASDEKLALLEAAARQRFTNAPPERLAAAFAEAHQASAALAPEFRGPADSALTKLEAGWTEFVERERAGASERLTTLLATIEKAAESELQTSREPRAVLESAEKIRRAMAPAQTLAGTPVLQPKQEPLFRLQTLQARVDKIAREATNWFAGQAALANATNFETYNSALRMLVESGFTPASERAAASAMAGMNLSSKTLLAPLLLPNGPATALQEPPRPGRTPEQVAPAERDIQRLLRDDQNIHGVSRLDVEVKTLPAEDPRRRRTLFLRGELQRRITRKSGLIYDPVESPNALSFAPKEMGSLEFSVDEPTSTAEHELYERTGLSRLLDSNTGQYQISLLMALDDINQDRRANALFRAYLFLRVAEMMDAQPVEWGAIWSPALAKDRAELNRLNAGQIHSGDWMVPVKNVQRAPALAAHFDRASLHSYARESAVFKRLLPRAMEIGARLVGSISADGKPVFTTHQTTGAVWGLRAPGTPAEILFQNGQERAPGAPFSPLFVFAGNPVDLLDSTLQSLSYPTAAAGLMENMPEILRAGL